MVKHKKYTRKEVEQMFEDENIFPDDEDEFLNIIARLAEFMDVRFEFKDLPDEKGTQCGELIIRVKLFEN